MKISTRHRNRINFGVGLICALFPALVISGCVTYRIKSEIKPVAAKAGGGFVCGASTVDDVEGNTYSTVLIGDQCWMGENMRTTEYPGGSSITKGPSAQGSAGWASDGKYYSCPPDTYNNFEDCAAAGGAEKLGMLYQWSAAMNGSTSEGAQGICPPGWHIPTHDEFTTLERAVCTSGTCITDFPFDTTTTDWRGATEGDEMKKAGLCEGRTPCGSSSFDSLLAGCRRPDGNYDVRGTAASFWSSTPSPAGAWRRLLHASDAEVLRYMTNKAVGFSVRCLKD